MFNVQSSHDTLQIRQQMRCRHANKGRRYPTDPPRVEADSLGQSSSQGAT
jgi:hypothetical protein